MITLTHRILKLKTEFTVRKSVLHKVRNYIITLPDQPDLDKALVLLGILDRRGGLLAGVPDISLPVLAVDLPISAARSSRAASWPITRRFSVWRSQCQASNMPRGFAICWSRLGSMLMLNARRGSYAVYVKSAEEIEHLLKLIGAKRSVAEIEEARAVKLIKNNVNRRVNAELANQTRSARCCPTSACAYR